MHFPLNASGKRSSLSFCALKLLRTADHEGMKALREDVPPPVLSGTPTLLIGEK